jgi:hypothetical protein
MLAASIIEAVSDEVSKLPPLMALMLEVENTSETSANIYQTARRNNLEDNHLEKTSSCLYHIAL